MRGSSGSGNGSGSGGGGGYRPDDETSTGLPADVTAEIAALGAAMLLPRSREGVREILRAEDFYRPAHGRIWQAMERLIARGEPVDRVTVQAELDARGELLEVGGTDYLLRISEVQGRATNAVQYARIVREKARRRALIETAYRVMSRAEDEMTDIDQVVAEAEAMICASGAHDHARSPMEPARAIAQRYLALVEERTQRQAQLPGIGSGMRSWDWRTGGLQQTHLLVMAGRPGTGKTAAAVTIALHVAGEGRPVAFFSLEMSALQLMGRILTNLSGIPERRLAVGRLSRAERERLRAAVDRVSEMPLRIHDASGQTPSQVASLSRRVRSDEGDLGLVVVDYMQIMSPDQGQGRRTSSRDEEIGSIARGLKATAKVLEVAVLALAQLNRAVERRENKRPTMADLEGSGKIEAEADSITMLYRPGYYSEPEQATTPAPGTRGATPYQPQPYAQGLDQDGYLEDGTAQQDAVDMDTRQSAEWILVKNRAGARGIVACDFLPARFAYADVEEGDRW